MVHSCNVSFPKRKKKQVAWVLEEQKRNRFFVDGKQISTKETATRIVLVDDIFCAMTRQVQYMAIHCTPKVKELNLCTTCKLCQVFVHKLGQLMHMGKGTQRQNFQFLFFTDSYGRFNEETRVENRLKKYRGITKLRHFLWHAFTCVFMTRHDFDRGFLHFAAADVVYLFAWAAPIEFFHFWCAVYCHVLDLTSHGTKYIVH